MSLFGVLGNARGHRLLASGAVPRRRVKRLPAERLAAERLAGVLELLSAASPTAAPQPLEGGDPQHASGARQPRHARALPTAPSVTDRVSPTIQVPAPEVPVAEVPVAEAPAPEVLTSEVLTSEVLTSEVPGAGRHRRPGAQAAVDSPHLIPAPEAPAPGVTGTGRHRRPGVPAAVDWAPPSRAPAISTPGRPGAGHHRRSGIRAAMALGGFSVASRRVVLLGVLVLLVAFAAVLQIRGTGALESAQPHVDAATSQSVTLTVPGTK